MVLIRYGYKEELTVNGKYYNCYLCKLIFCLEYGFK